jgi:hypothetical protein
LGAIDRFCNQSIIHSKVKFWPNFSYCYLNSIACMLGSTLYALCKSRSLSKLFPLMWTGKLGQYISIILVPLIFSLCLDFDVTIDKSVFSFWMEFMYN